MFFTLFFAIVLILFPTISATPLPYRQIHAKRGTTSQNVGSGFAIAVCIVFLAAIFYYLGMRHERTRSWFSKRKTSTQSEPSRGSGGITERRRHKRQISCPLAVSSSAPIKPYDDPIEVPTPSLRYYEMPVEEIHEMGLPSPKKPPPRASWWSLDCKPWWLLHAEDKQQSGSSRTVSGKSMSNWFKNARSSNGVAHKEASARCSTLQNGHTGLNKLERVSDRISLLDWSGLEHVRRFYAERKSKITL